MVEGGREGVVKGAVGGRSALRKDPQLGKPENPPHWLQVTNAIYGTVLSANILLGMTTYLNNFKQKIVKESLTILKACTFI